MKNKISKEIKEIRQDLGLTQVEFTKLFNRSAPRKLKITDKDLSKYELGLVRVFADTYTKFKSLRKGA